MAGIFAAAQTPEIVATTESGEDGKTILQLEAAANHAVRVIEVSISFDGESNTAPPAFVKLCRQTSAGTMDGLTPEKLNEADDETIQTTCLQDADAEPTTGNAVWSEFVHLQGGISYPLPHPITIIGGNRLGLVVVTDEVVNCAGRLMFEE